MEIPEGGIDMMTVADQGDDRHLEQLAELAERGGQNRSRPAEGITGLGIEHGHVAPVHHPSELANEGDEVALGRLAAENGIPMDSVKAYMNMESDYLCEDVTDAALGRIDIEADDIGAEEIMGDWADYIRSLIMDKEEFARKVMNPKKSFIGCVGQLAVYSVMHAEPVPKEIINAMKAAVTDAQLKKLHLEKRHLDYTKIGMPGIGTAKRIIRSYYEED
jgi:hypothetical protein